MPFGQRKKVVEKSRSRSKKGKSDSKTPEVCAGMQVCLRSTPIYHIGKRLVVCIHKLFYHSQVGIQQFLFW